MRLSIDDEYENEPRAIFAAARLGISRFEFDGRIFRVWMQAYRGRSAIMPKRNVDALAQLPGFADALLAEDLASPVDDDSVRVRLRGVTKRIDFLHIQDAKRELAAAAKRAKAGLPREHPPGPPRRASAGDAAGGPYISGSGSASGSDKDQDTDTHTDRPSTKRAPRASEIPADALRLAGLLVSLIASANPGTKIAKLSPEDRDREAARHAPHFDRLHRLDGHSWADIEAVLRWAKSDSFWSANVLSGEKFREKFDQLAAKRGSAAGGSAATSTIGANYTASTDWTRSPRKGPTQIALEELARLEQEERGGNH